MSDKHHVLLQELVDSGSLPRGSVVYLRVGNGEKKKEFKCHIESGLFGATYMETVLVYMDNGEKIMHGSPTQFAKSVLREDYSPEHILYIIASGKEVTLDELSKTYLVRSGEMET